MLGVVKNIVSAAVAMSLAESTVLSLSKAWMGMYGGHPDSYRIWIGCYEDSRVSYDLKM